MPHAVMSKSSTPPRATAPTVIKGHEHRTWYNLHHPKPASTRLELIRNWIALWYYRYEVFSATLILESWERTLFSNNEF